MSSTLNAILFDLDGTLLDNDMNTFLPAYFQRLGARVGHLVPPEQFVAHLLEATQVMMANDGRATNEEVFSAAFFPLAGHGRKELQPIFDDFYAQDYPALRAVTRPIAGAREVVQACFDRGLDVVIATNPVFPATAIHQRVEWAGVADFPYRLITTYENSRACKPNPLYFRHILDLLGHAAGSCLMVGNESFDLAAAQVGCPTLLVGDDKIEPGSPEPTYRGTLAEVTRLIG